MPPTPSWRSNSKRALPLNIDVSARVSRWMLDGPHGKSAARYRPSSRGRDGRRQSAERQRRAGAAGPEAAYAGEGGELTEGGRVRGGRGVRGRRRRRIGRRVDEGLEGGGER